MVARGKLTPEQAAAYEEIAEEIRAKNAALLQEHAVAPFRAGVRAKAAAELIAGADPHNIVLMRMRRR